jgi:photosystem II stability/assembly factor-like uncharacterized protein
MRQHIMMALALFAMACCVSAQATGKDTWTVTGIGGAGGMYTPTISPFDPNLMFLSCDMSGTYRSSDGGKSWQLIHYMQLRTSLRCRPAFTKDAIFWAEEGTLKYSKDKGVTWTAVEFAGGAPWKDTITNIAALDAKTVLVGATGGVWSVDTVDEGKAGAKYKELATGKCGGLALVGQTFYAAVPAKGGRGARILVSTVANEGYLKITWRSEFPVPQAGENAITALAAASANAKESGQAAVCIYATADSVGILKSADSGKTWSVVARWQEQRDILVPQGQTEVAYASQEGQHEVWRTDDGGKTWKSIFHMTGNNKNVDVAWDQTYLHWDYSISHLGIGIDSNDPNVVMMTSEGDFYRSNDGGKKWFQCQNEAVGVKEGDPGFRFKSIGVEVTSLWGYYFDPNDANRQYIAYTDIGFIRSVDKGATWMSAVEGCPWSNTYYEIAFDPYVKGRIYAACSQRHDIPHWTHLDANKGQKGGVCVSDDYGATWNVLGKGLPELPCTSIAVDPKSPREKLTLYTTLYEGGVYKSTDGGATWVKKSNGLGNPGNLHAIRIRIHPKSGNLYCMITAFRKGETFPGVGGLWVSKDGGESWNDLAAQHKFPRPTDFAISPVDENTIYINASTISGASVGGIYKTTDGGKEWKRLLTDADFGKWCAPSYYEGSTVNLHPDDPKIVYVGTESHGLWYSTDAGKTWKVYESFPFGSPQNVAFEPTDHKKMVVTTFGGGAWRGAYLPAAVTAGGAKGAKSAKGKD